MFLSLFFFFFLQIKHLTAMGPLKVLDVLSCFNQEVTLNMDAVWFVLFGKGFQEGVALCISAGLHPMAPISWGWGVNGSLSHLKLKM